MGGDARDPRDQVGVDPIAPASEATRGGDAYDDALDRERERGSGSGSSAGAHVTGGPAVSGSAAGPPEYPEGRWAPSAWFVDPSPDLDHAIQAAGIALSQHSLADPTADWIDMARVAVEAAWPHLTSPAPHHGPEARAEVMERRWRSAQAELQATRDRLAALEKRHNDLAATIREWHLECIRLERERDEAEVRLAAALDGPAAQEEGGGG